MYRYIRDLHEKYMPQRETKYPPCNPARITNIAAVQPHGIGRTGAASVVGCVHASHIHRLIGRRILPRATHPRTNIWVKFG